MKKISSVVTTLLLGSFVAFAQQKVEKIEIKSLDNRPISADLVNSRMTLQPGMTFSNEALSNDVKSLVNSGLFEKVECYTRAGNDKDSLIIDVQLVIFPEIRNVYFVGNSEFDTDDLGEEIKLHNGSTLSDKSLANDKKAIIQLYENKSYFGTEVDFKMHRIGENLVDILWIINEKPRYKIRDITFPGNNFFKIGELQDELITQKNIFSYIFPCGYLNEMDFSEDERRLEKTFNDSGFLDFKFKGVKQNYFDLRGEEKGKIPDVAWIKELKDLPVNTEFTEGKVNLEYELESGERYRVGSIKIVGNTVFTEEKLLYQYAGKSYKCPILESVFIDGRNIDDVIRKIKNDYYSLGYIDFTVNVRYEKRKENDSYLANIVLEISEGKAATIRNIDITGNRMTQDKVIRRELSLLPGNLANKNKIEESKSRLKNMDYFENVDIIPVVTEKEDQRDLKVDVIGKDTGQFMIGAGFSTEDSVIGSIEVQQTNFDLFNSKSYFTGAGQKMRFRLQLGSENSEVLLSLTEPWLFNRKLSLSSSFYYKERFYDNYDQQTIGTTWAITRELERFWRSTTGYTLEQIQIDNFERNATKEMKSNEGDFLVSKIFQKWSRNSTNRYRFPTNGSLFETTVELQSELFGAYTNSYKLNLNYDKYFKISRENDVTLRLGTKIGHVNEISGDDIGIFDRYFAGGPGTVRGFKYRTVSPVDSQEEALGGKSMLTLTAEVMYPITENLRFVLFTDAGNVWEDEFGYDAQLNVGAGFGFRIILPIAPISIDYGFPIVRQEEHLNSSGRLYFNVGFSF